MRSRLTSFAWIAFFGILLQAGSAAASVWCPELGLLFSCCCPVEAEVEAAWEAPNECCRPALPAPETQQAEKSAPSTPILAVLSWEEALPPQPTRPLASLRGPAPPAPQLDALSTIVLIQ